MLEKNIPDKNIFMMCEKLNKNALTKLPDGFYIRHPREDEIDLWCYFPFDSKEEQLKNYDYMLDYFNKVYDKDLFLKTCLFVCEEKTDKPVCTCFIWKSYDKINTIHWFKTLKEYEGKGIGRALLSAIMSSLDDKDFPIYLHTQPSSFRAIGMYSSFGFKIVTNEKIGYRKNEYKESLPILKYFMREKDYKKLEFVKADKIFDESAKSSKISQF